LTPPCRGTEPRCSSPRPNTDARCLQCRARKTAVTAVTASGQAMPSSHGTLPVPRLFFVLPFFRRPVTAFTLSSGTTGQHVPTTAGEHGTVIRGGLTMSACDTTPSLLPPREGLDFDLEGDIPRHWFAGDAFKTRFFDAMST